MTVANQKTWATPRFVMYPVAADRAHFVAVPLLVAASVTLIGVVGADGDEFRWPGPSLLAFTVASVMLVSNMHLGFRARTLLYSAKDLQDWYGEKEFESRAEELRDEQRKDFERWKFVVRIAVFVYNIGVSSLALGVALCLAAPDDSERPDLLWRWLAFGIAAACALVEFGWAFVRVIKISNSTSDRPPA